MDRCDFDRLEEELEHWKELEEVEHLGFLKVQEEVELVEAVSLQEEVVVFEEFEDSKMMEEAEEVVEHLK